MRDNLRSNLFSVWNDFTHLVFPNICLSCNNELSKNESHVCSFCSSQFTPTLFHQYDEPSEMDKLFWGRVNINNTYAHFYFEKDKPIQGVLFNFKYKDNPDLGLHFGKEIAKVLKTHEAFKDVDAYIPVPLHPKKEFIRGYNQSEVLAKGICNELEVKLDTKLLKRNTHSETQTKKSRFQRWDNVNSIFSVDKNIINYKHVVIVDDVITTGSTIESICVRIKEMNPDILISVVTLAIA